MQNKLPNEEIKIHDKDVVSGWFFRKFIDDYKAYDKRQKELIDELNTKIEEQHKEIKKYKRMVPGHVKETFNNQEKYITDLKHKLDIAQFSAVSYEQAKGLEELGYEVNVKSAWRRTTHCYAIVDNADDKSNRELISWATADGIIAHGVKVITILAPTLRQAILFLEEKDVYSFITELDKEKYTHPLNNKIFKRYDDCQRDLISEGIRLLKLKYAKAL